MREQITVANFAFRLSLAALFLALASRGEAGEWRSGIYCDGRFVAHGGGYICQCADGTRLNLGQSCPAAAPKVDMPRFDLNSEIGTDHDSTAAKTLFKFFEKIGKSVNPLDDGEKLSSAVEGQSKPNVSLPPGFLDPFESKERAQRTPEEEELTRQPGYSPFSRQVEKRELYDDLRQQQEALKPPAGYVDPFAGKGLPQPGTLGKYPPGSCTFDSPACR